MDGSLNVLALGVAAFETITALKKSDPDTDFDTICNQFYPRLQNMISSSDDAPSIPEVPERRDPKPVKRSDLIFLLFRMRRWYDGPDTLHWLLPMPGMYAQTFPGVDSHTMISNALQ